MDIEDLHGVSLKNDRDFMMKLDSLKPSGTSQLFFCENSIPLHATSNGT
jgi:hypothetical protein